MNTQRNYVQSELVDEVVGKIAELMAPRKIYLYNQRIGADGDTTSFKLCVIAPVEHKVRAERDIYLAIDCEVPFDLLLYTPEEWAQLTTYEGSFACHIQKKGMVVYHG